MEKSIPPVAITKVTPNDKNQEVVLLVLIIQCEPFFVKGGFFYVGILIFHLMQEKHPDS